MMWTGLTEAFILRVSNLTLSRAPCPAGNGFPMEQWTMLSIGLHVYFVESCTAQNDHAGLRQPLRSNLKQFVHVKT